MMTVRRYVWPLGIAAMCLGIVLSGLGVLVAATGCYNRTTSSWASAVVCATGMQSGALLIATDTLSASWKRPTRTYAANAVGLVVDGTLCTKSDAQVNSGRKRTTITCANDAGSTWWGGLEMPAAWDGGTVVFILTALSVNATPSGNLQVDCKCQCRGASATIDNTWGTAQSVTVTFATQYVKVRGVSPAATCNGTCAVAGSTVELNWQCNVNTSGTTTTQMSDVRILDGGVQYVAGGSDA